MGHNVIVLKLYELISALTTNTICWLCTEPGFFLAQLTSFVFTDVSRLQFFQLGEPT